MTVKIDSDYDWFIKNYPGNDGEKEAFAKGVNIGIQHGRIKTLNNLLSKIDSVTESVNRLDNEVTFAIKESPLTKWPW